ncbi:MAG: hypothetical protein LBD01_02465 [Puniceicoccales bacterium]|nr:hypothetical protein [Puniceicoccales bacterium]
MPESLSQEQKKNVAEWVTEGASLSEIQKRINGDFGLSMTYMDVRFLVDDLDLVLKDKTQAAAQPENLPAADNSSNDTDTNDMPSLGPDDYSAAAPAPKPAHANVSVSVDPVQRPGIAAGGSVTFSDGQTGQWQLDSYGQLGFIPPYDGYQPSAADVQQFQVALRRELSKGGY